MHVIAALFATGFFLWALPGSAAPEAAEAAEADSQTAKNPNSLTDSAPELVSVLRRKPDFFGSPWHREGSILERGSLTGDWGGSRQSLVDKGIYVDLGITQVLQSGLQGGARDGRGPRYRGSADYYLTLDTEKLGLWPGGLIMMNGESNFGDSAGDQVGSIIPSNMDALFPDPAGGGANTTLSELYFVQALSPKLIVAIGKINALGLGDQNAYANNERTQFMNLGLNFNPMLGAFVPYTPLGLAVILMPTSDLQVTTSVVDSEGGAGTAGFDTVFTKGTTLSQEWDLTLRPFEQKGTYRLGFLYTDKNVSTYEADPRTLLARLLGLVPRNNRDDNWTIYGNFDQALWTIDAKEGRSVGVFFRFAVAPDDRNAIDQFYSLGIGGKGAIPGRAHDRFGVGWTYSHISSELKSALRVLGADPTNEQAIELFYNFELTPAAHLTADLQFVLDPFGLGDPARTSPDFDNRDLAIAGGLRLQLDF